MSAVDVGTARLVAGGLPTPDAVEVGLTALEAMSLSAAGDTLAALCDEVERLRRALAVAACNRIPGPDGQDYADRAALIAEWISEGAEFDQLAGITSWEDVERRVEADQ